MNFVRLGAILMTILATAQIALACLAWSSYGRLSAVAWPINTVVWAWLASMWFDRAERR